MISIKYQKSINLGVMASLVIIQSICSDPTHTLFGVTPQKEVWYGEIEVGGFVPDFQLKDETGGSVRLSDLCGKKVALVFYPLDWTPHCTKQLCSLRNGYKELQKAGIVVLGISHKSVKDNNAFKIKHNLPFPLLSDHKKKVAKLYGAKRWAGPNKRITILINEEGRLVAILKDKDIDVSTHADQIIEAFKNS